TDDVFVSMPPMPFEYEGRDVAARFCASIFRSGRRFDLVPTRAAARASSLSVIGSPFLERTRCVHDVRQVPDSGTSSGWSMVMSLS
ncbi:MAG: hypothetical protein M3P43_15545, partial [Actinomycetota bacterium]|nr:hypothetical protein [Actinomycetota bacterium]